jgi:hypothetical protein
MMQLVKKGTKNKRTFKGTCYKCGSEFQANEQELNVKDDQREGTFAQEECTECEATVTLYPVGGESQWRDY